MQRRGLNVWQSSHSRCNSGFATLPSRGIMSPCAFKAFP